MNDVRKIFSKTLIHSEDSPFQQIILSSNKFASHVEKKEASNLSLINLSTSLFLTLYLSTPYLVRMGVFRFASFIPDHELMIPGSKNSDPASRVPSLSLFLFWRFSVFANIGNPETCLHLPKVLHNKTKLSRREEYTMWSFPPCSDLLFL